MRLIDADALADALFDKRKNYPQWVADTIGNMPDAVVRCKDCKHFEIKDYWADFGGVPILAASDCPTCNKWADGCMTKPDGYCYMAERRG